MVLSCMQDRRIRIGRLVASVLVFWCVFSYARADSPIILRDVTKETGITFKHTDGGCGRRYIMETVSAGLALFDYDRDGDVDIYFLNGAPLKGTKVDAPPRNALYRNEGGWKFTDVTREANVGDTGYGLGVAVGNYDNDGDLDIYLNNYGPNVLYRNNGDGTFTDISKDSGVGAHPGWGMGIVCGDYDNDGDTDVFIGNDVAENFLFANDGTGKFEEVGLMTGFAYDLHGDEQGSMGVDCGDPCVCHLGQQLRRFGQRRGSGHIRRMRASPG